MKSTNLDSAATGTGQIAAARGRRLQAALAVMAAAAALLLVLGAAAASGPARAAAPAGAPAGVTAVLQASGFTKPVDIAHTGLLTDTRLFVVEKEGRIRIALDDGTLLVPPFLDISAQVTSTAIEQGLLSMAFAPDFAQSRHFFVYYVALDGSRQLSRYSVSSVDATQALTVETPLLTIDVDDDDDVLTEWHNGAELAFGPDGYLYVSVGDGGLSYYAQVPGSLFGKILRLNVTGVPTYTIPAGNPFTQTVAARGEVWSLGLRNPWRMSFDRQTGDLYIGDVGEHEREEINVQPAGSAGGENYGWRCYEGRLVFNPTGCGPASAYVFSLFEYPHSLGSAVVGGHVYRGAQSPGMQGYYLFADNASGRFWALQPETGLTVNLPDVGVQYPSTFGEDAHGELYVASYFSGSIYRLEGNVIMNLAYLPAIVTQPEP